MVKESLEKQLKININSKKIKKPTVELSLLTYSLLYLLTYRRTFEKKSNMEVIFLFT